jgi:FKBP-type peptidyl-prolyl cis-trans isomerase
MRAVIAHGDMEMGIERELIKAAEPATPVVGDRVSIHYIGMLENGQQFDSSRAEGREPLVFTLGKKEVISGLDQAVAQMAVGERSKWTITPELAYQAEGILGIIPPNETLIFDVELLKIV